MRMKRSRIKEFFCRKAETVKDHEGGASVEFGPPVAFKGEAWPAGGRMQAEQYGERLAYICNVRVQGKYEVSRDEKSRLRYLFSDTGLDVAEGDGLCLFVGSDEEPDYRVISIRPYGALRLEAEKKT